ncbi:UDP-N-acetylmuramate dehydrogenase [Myroides sp. LJL116]
MQKNISLQPYNTFAIQALAKDFILINTQEELIKALKENNNRDLFILGGGSNMLLTQDIEKLVLKINTKGIAIVQQDTDHVIVEVQAGENWHEFVLWAIDNDFGGIENLSLIPGNVGTTPIQNIGAYGVEVKDTIVSCQALDIDKISFTTFSNQDCQFSYRESVFKNELKDRYIITSVSFKLTKNNHLLKTQYGDIQAKLDSQNIQYPTIRDISNSVIQIRQEKLPDPKVIGNSGSFFKNPILPKEQFERLVQEYPQIPNYPLQDGKVKVPAGWLIEKAGFKGFRIKDAGVHEKQALVLVNHGEATGKEILELSKAIQAKVRELFQIDIQPEVNIF